MAIGSSFCTPSWLPYTECAPAEREEEGPEEVVDTSGRRSEHYKFNDTGEDEDGDVISVQESADEEIMKEAEEVVNENDGERDR